MKPKVFNKHHGDAPADAVYCGRGSPYGNPFAIGKDGNRDEVCDKFAKEILPTLDVSALKGKSLICFCAPKRCHCDDILKKANMAKASKVKAEPNPLLEQLRFVSTILSKKGEQINTHAVIANGTITAQNEAKVSVGILTETPLKATVHCHQFLAALERCKDGYALTEARGSIALSSGPLRVNLPIMEDTRPSAQPDGYTAPLPPALLEAVRSIVGIADEKADYLEASSICLEEGLASAVNPMRSVIIQAYHGINMPAMMVPVTFFKRLESIDKVPTGWGHSSFSFTVFFDDNSWIRTQLADCEPLPYSKVCAKEGGFKPLPDIWEALETIMPFRGNTDAVRFEDDAVKTDTASYEQILGERIRINADYLKQCKPHIEHFAIDNGKFYFYKGNVRGVIALMD